jgi:hypothetical protein
VVQTRFRQRFTPRVRHGRAQRECFDGECAGGGGDGYDDCHNGDPTCGGTNMCLVDNPAAPTVGVCTQACNVVAECPAAPAGGIAACEDLTGDGISECFVSCESRSCPAGMTCFADVLCAWN